MNLVDHSKIFPSNCHDLQVIAYPSSRGYTGGCGCTTYPLCRGVDDEYMRFTIGLWACSSGGIAISLVPCCVSKRMCVHSGGCHWVQGIITSVPCCVSKRMCVHSGGCHWVRGIITSVPRCVSERTHVHSGGCCWVQGAYKML
jgi:hypothetical protein